MISPQMTIYDFIKNQTADERILHTLNILGLDDVSKPPTSNFQFLAPNYSNDDFVSFYPRYDVKFEKRSTQIL